MTIFLSLIGFCAGASLGSFASATTWAWLRHESPPIFRSLCDRCGHILRTRDLIPLASYLVLRGKCSFCGAKIPPFHFWIELASACAGALITVRYGSQWLTLPSLFLAVALIAASAADMASGYLPDFLTLGCVLLIPAIAFLSPQLSFTDACIGYALGAAIPLCLYLIFKICLHKESLGMGDVKLFALGGGVAGWQNLPMLFFLSSVSAICFFTLAHIWKRDPYRPLFGQELPFGPFISLAIITMLLFPQISAYFYGLFY